ncbi:protein kinase domain-containing protein [Nocardia sp. NPDC055321]
MSGSLERGHVFADYEIEYLIGSGGMGEVYLARDNGLDRMIALKVLRPLASIDPDLRKRFDREARAVAALIHPNIIAIHAAGTENGRPWIAMSYVDGPELDRELRTGPLDLSRAASIVSDVAEALDFAHSKGILHRDVKPANVLLTAGICERAILTDFGIAKAVHDTSRLTLTSNMIGSFRYAAPERFDFRAEVDGRADVYSLGCTLYQFLTGALPYDGDTVQLVAAHSNAPIPKPSAENAAVPTAFDGIIARALAKAPDDRFATCSQLATAVRRVVAHERAAPHETLDIADAWPDIRAKARAYGAAVAALLEGASIVRVEERAIVLTHVHQPLAQRLAQPQNVTALRSAVRAVTGRDYEVRWESGPAPKAGVRATRKPHGGNAVRSRHRRQAPPL